MPPVTGRRIRRPWGEYCFGCTSSAGELKRYMYHGISDIESEGIHIAPLLGRFNVEEEIHLIIISTLELNLFMWVIISVSLEYVK